MFNLFKKKTAEHVLGSPAKGKAVAIQEVNDPTFAEEILGKGIAVIPSEGKIYAPADGEIGMVFDTLHAVSLVTDFAAEVLIHVGLDTVKLKGDGFESHVKAGDKVKKGDLLLTVDLDKVKAAGYDIVTPMLICNSPDYARVEGMAVGEVGAGADILIVESK